MENVSLVRNCRNPGYFSASYLHLFLPFPFKKKSQIN